MAVYLTVRGSSGAGVLYCLRDALNNNYSTFMILTVPPYDPLHYNDTTVFYTNYAMGYADIPPRSFTLSGRNLVYAPIGGFSVPITYSGRANWFALEIPRQSKTLLFWPGTGVYLNSGQQYLITNISIPLAET